MIFRLLARAVRSVLQFLGIAIVVLIIAGVGFVYFKGHSPMPVSQLPAGMTYWQFLGDRLDAAQEVKPKQCGIGRLAIFVLLAPVYSVVYTEIGLHPGGFLDRVSQDDANIPVDVKGTPWYGVPDLWWAVFEKISWSMLARPTPACNFRPVEIASP